MFQARGASDFLRSFHGYRVPVVHPRRPTPCPPQNIHALAPCTVPHQAGSLLICTTATHTPRRTENKIARSAAPRGPLKRGQTYPNPAVAGLATPPYRFTEIPLYRQRYSLWGMRIVVTNTKGGVGKTTTSIYLGMALVPHGSVQVLDADPQGSATEWALRAEESGQPLPFPVQPVNAAQLRRGRESAEFTIIDTAPGDAQGIDAALSGARVAIIPTAPSGIDMSRVWDTEAVSSAVTDSFVLITQADARTKAFKAVLDVLEESGVGYFETTIQRRESIRQSFGTRPTDLAGYESAAAELLEAVK